MDDDRSARALCRPTVQCRRFYHLVRNSPADLRLMTASSGGQVAAIHEALGSGARVNCIDECGATPLHLASHCGHTAAVQALLAGGADVGAVDIDRATPLHHAATQGRKEAVAALLASGADPNAQRHMGCTPLHCAAAAGCAAVVETLLAGGAAVSATDEGGWQPLHRASIKGRVHAVAALLAGGAEVNAAAPWGRMGRMKGTPLALASAVGEQEVVATLLHRGADPTITVLPGVQTVDVVCRWSTHSRSRAAPAIKWMLRAAMAWQRRSAVVVACVTEMWEDSLAD